MEWIRLRALPRCRDRFRRSTLATAKDEQRPHLVLDVSIYSLAAGRNRGRGSGQVEEEALPPGATSAARSWRNLELEERRSVAERIRGRVFQIGRAHV